MAFLEPSGFDESQTPPERKLIIALCRSIGRLMAALPGSGIADRFVPCFLDAGLESREYLGKRPWWDRLSCSFNGASGPTKRFFPRWSASGLSTLLSAIPRP